MPNGGSVEKRIAAIFLLLFHLLGRGVIASAQELHPKLKSGEKTIRTVLVLPPKVEIVRQTVKGVEGMIKESPYDFFLHYLVTESVPHSPYYPLRLDRMTSSGRDARIRTTRKKFAILVSSLVSTLTPPRRAPTMTDGPISPAG